MYNTIHTKTQHLTLSAKNIYSHKSIMK